jgi:yecA family protein
MAGTRHTWDDCASTRRPGTGTMKSEVNYDNLNDALWRCGATWDAAQVHGLLSSRLAVAGRDAGFDWLQQALEGTDPADALRTECTELLNALFEDTLRQLSERLSEFEPLLPDDSDSASLRATALAHWCEGFLHGLVSVDHGDALRQRLAEDPLADIIRDMLQLTRAAADDGGDDETNESAYAEIVEYVRVAVQLAYEELAEFRSQPEDPQSESGDTLH